MPTSEPRRPATVAQIVNRAVDVVDPQGENEGVAQLQARFEDDDQPIVGAIALDRRLAEAKGAIDPQDEDPAVTMAVAVVNYLAHRRDELGDVPEDILRLTARAEFDGEPPPQVVDWLAAQGVSL